MRVEYLEPGQQQEEQADSPDPMGDAGGQFLAPDQSSGLWRHGLAFLPGVQDPFWQ